MKHQKNPLFDLDMMHFVADFSDNQGFSNIPKLSPNTQNVVLIFSIQHEKLCKNEDFFLAIFFLAALVLFNHWSVEVQI